MAQVAAAPLLTPPPRLPRAAGARRVKAMLAAVLSLQIADTSAIGAMAPALERGLGVSHAQIGLLVSTSLLVAGLATLPLGVLADRVHRPRLLTAAIVTWSVALVACGAAPSFGALLGARVFLGGVAAAAWPAVASLAGDIFAPAERGRVLGQILTGELAGAGAGFLVSGTAAGLVGWRAGFWVLVPPSLLLAWLIHRALPDPPRRVAAGGRRGWERMPLPHVVRHVLRVRTNRLLIIASALAYLFLAAEQTFGLEFLRRQYDLAQPAAATVFVVLSAGALAGVLLGGRIADALLARGRPDARPLVAGIALVVSAVAFAVALVMPSLALAAGPFVVAAAMLEAPNPPLDAARLDVVPAPLWARAEGVRAVLRNTAQAGGPLLFGVLVDLLAPSAGRAEALRAGFAAMVLALLVSGVVVLRSRRSYERDRRSAGAEAER